MIQKPYAQVMARYNEWQNRSCYREAGRLSDADRKADRGAFFKSIEGTLAHILWGDQIWMSRFAGAPPPRAKSIAESSLAYERFEDLAAERVRFDAVIAAWADEVDPDWFDGDLTWFSGATGRELTRPRALLVMQMFNHQTHHRGQAHAMLTALGMKPDDTDIPFMPGL